LRLTPEEAAAIVRHRSPKQFTRKQISALHEATHGWAAGLTLMLEQMPDQFPRETVAFKTPGVLFEYFANEVFSKTDSDTRAVLLKSVFLPTMTIRSVAELTEERRASRILNHLCRNNFFTYRFELPEPVFQYHPLFREFLLSRARRMPDPELTALKQRAASILEKDDQHELALPLFEEIEEWEGFSRCVLKLAPRMLAQSRHLALEHWLSRLPDARISANPWLLYYRGVCLQQTRPDVSRIFFQNAHEQFQTSGDLAGLLRNWSAMIETHLSEWVDFTPIRTGIESLEKIPGILQLLKSNQVEPSSLCTYFLAICYGRPTDPELPFWAERTATILRSTSDIQLRVRVATHLLFYYVWLEGDLPKAGALYHALHPLYQERDVPPLSQIAWLATIAGLRWLSAENEQCLSVIRTALMVADNTQNHGWDTQLMACGIFAALSEHRIDETESFFSRLDSIHNPVNTLDSSLYYLLKAGHHLHQNDLPRARQYLEQGLVSARNSGHTLLEADCLTDLSRVLYYLGEHAQAQECLLQARGLGNRLTNPVISYHTWMTEAELALLAGDESGCRNALQYALSLGRRQHIRNHRWWRATLMARLYERALDAAIEREYVLDMIRHHSLQPPDEARESDSWPFPIKVYTLGRFALVKDDQTLTVSGKAQSKPLELLKALIALGGRQVGAAHLSEVLWPDADGDSAQRAFDTTLHRLRRLLGTEQALLLSDSKLSLNPACCWVDGWALERLIGHLDLLLKQSSPDNTQHNLIAQMARKLYSLHHGPFLGREQIEPWAISPRERLEHRYLVTLGALGRYWEAQEHWERAAETYQKAIDAHIQAEEYYQRLMQVYLRLGRSTDASAVYQRCRETLLATTGRPPSVATEALHQAVASNADDAS